MSSYTVDRFDHDGLTMLVRRYAQGGDGGTASPLTFLLVHGIGVSPNYFARLSEQLRPHGIVYAVELPGFGATPRPERALGIEDFAVLLTAFSKAWKLDNPVLVGHSMGTQIVTEMAVRNPALSDRVVLMGSVVDPDAPTPFGQGFRLFRDMLIEPPSANVIVLMDYLRCGPRWYLAQLPAMLTYPLEARLPLLEAFTLVVRGARDPVAPAEWSKRIAELIPRSARLDVPKAAHVVQHRAARVVAAAILDHARSSVAGPGLQARGEREL
jgi:pimeloyl-ACP methyl ester carboxylesterase